MNGPSTFLFKYWKSGYTGSERKTATKLLAGIRRQCSVPHGAALTTQAHERPPREYVERLFPNVIRWTDLQKGGLFVALEEPDAIVGFFSYALGLNHCAS
ncbi:hypothetical protein [Paenibacillus sp. 23TSA30-6]|uniref:hypothetical protein n=1 Tax=Paenibacillus sp. 23TSA30-6 TaxID=2546104 RepID=UPI00178892EC|nr:hypothetical protein [Paenibacillus sp. 23TSA30-6]MBE0337036.1 hypothetical protein [Paenibacillus sp. 23TSA30-6]